MGAELHKLAQSSSTSRKQSDRDYFGMLKTQAESDEAVAERALVRPPGADEVAAAEGRVVVTERDCDWPTPRWRKPACSLPPRVGSSASTANRVECRPQYSPTRPPAGRPDESPAVRGFEELDAPRVKVGSAVVTADGLPGMHFPGTVKVTFPRIGRRGLQTDAASEYKDIYFREVLIDLDAGEECHEPTGAVAHRRRPGGGAAMTPGEPTTRRGFTRPSSRQGRLELPRGVSGIGALSPPKSKSTSGRSKLAIVGMGGVGGAHLITLTRLGIGSSTSRTPTALRWPTSTNSTAPRSAISGGTKPRRWPRSPRHRGRREDRGTPHLQYGRYRREHRRLLKGVEVLLDGIDFFAIEARHPDLQRGAAARDLGHHRRSHRVQCRLARLRPDGYGVRCLFRYQ